MPPISCTSKCRIPKTRRDASRMTAKASGRISSSVSPFANRSRNTNVISESFVSLIATICGSNGLIFSSTILRSFLTSFSLDPLNNLSKIFSMPSTPYFSTVSEKHFVLYHHFIRMHIDIYFNKIQRHSQNKTAFFPPIPLNREITSYYPIAI